MAALTGCLPVAPLYRQPPVSDNIGAFTGALLGEVALGSEGVGGARTSNLPIDQPEGARSGCLGRGLSDDWYGRVHVVPHELDLGNLLQVEVRSVEVWNGHFSDQLFSELQEQSTEGIEITEPVSPPYTFGPLISQIYDVTVDVLGPAVIDAEYTWVFPAETPGVHITGSRVVLWPLPPNWREPVLERLEWLTDVLEAADGSEQRIALRGVPRRSLEHRLTLAGADRRRAESWLYDWQARLFALPIWTHPAQLDAGASADDTVLSLDTSERGFAAERLAILWASPTQTEVTVIEQVSAGSLTLVTGLIDDWPAGTRVYPGHFARLDARQALDRLGGEVVEQTLRWRLDDPVAWPAVDSTGTYRSEPLLERAPSPNWREPPEHEHLRELRELDALTGARAVDDRTGVPIVIERWLWTEGGQSAIADLRAWLHARAGRLNGFWAATDLADLVLIASVGAAEITMDVEHLGYTRFLRQQAGRRDIRIRLRDGTVFLRRITDSAEVDADTERLTLDSALGQSVAPAEILQISWLSWWRLEADAVELAWLTDQLLETRLAVRGLGNEQ
jgi:hypothetical protein